MIERKKHTGAQGGADRAVPRRVPWDPGLLGVQRSTARAPPRPASRVSSRTSDTSTSSSTTARASSSTCRRTLTSSTTSRGTPGTPGSGARWCRSSTRSCGRSCRRRSRPVRRRGLRPVWRQFSFFSPSRFATYRCRWLPTARPFPGVRVRVGSRVQRSRGRRLPVRGGGRSRKSGQIDRTPASRNVHGVLGGPRCLARQPTQLRSAAATSASFTYTSTVSGAGYQCRLVPLARTVPLGSVRRVRRTFTGLAEGGYRFDVRARDASDEVSQPAAGWFFRVDTTGPTVAFSSAPAINTRSDRRPSGSSRRSRSAGSMTCTIDGRAIGCANGRITLPHVATGDTRWRSRRRMWPATAGTTSFDWTVDRTPPQRRDPGRSQRSCRWNPVSAFNLWSNEGPGFFGCSLDGGAAMPCFGAPNFTTCRKGGTVEGLVGGPRLQRVARHHVRLEDRPDPAHRVAWSGGPTEGSTSVPAR